MSARHRSSGGGWAPLALSALWLGAIPGHAAEMTASSVDFGGGRISSANYAADCAMGAIGGIWAAGPASLRDGFVGQLYDPVSLSISASPTNLEEGAARQLAAAQIMDDETALAVAASAVAWSVLSGPIDSVSTGGLATAGNVYQDTPATVGGSADGFSASLGLLVANVGSDDFGTYAADGIDDDWQVYYFGEGSPDAVPGKDPDRDGGDNRFESLALTVPTDPTSHFQLHARPIPGQPGQVDLVFSPIRDGRTYTVFWSPNMSPDSWTELTGAPQSDEDEERTVTDPDAAGPGKFYRVGISRP